MDAGAGGAGARAQTIEGGVRPRGPWDGISTDGIRVPQGELPAELATRQLPTIDEFEEEMWDAEEPLALKQRLLEEPSDKAAGRHRAAARALPELVSGVRLRQDSR